MLIQAIKNYDGSGSIRFLGDDGRLFKMLLKRKDLEEFSSLIGRLETHPDGAYSGLVDQVEMEIELHAFNYGGELQ